MTELTQLFDLLEKGGVTFVLFLVIVGFAKGYITSKAQNDELEDMADRAAVKTGKVINDNISDKIDKHEKQTDDKIVRAVKDGVVEAIKEIMPTIQHGSLEVLERLRSIESEIASLKKQEKDRSGRL